MNTPDQDPLIDCDALIVSTIKQLERCLENPRVYINTSPYRTILHQSLKKLSDVYHYPSLDIAFSPANTTNSLINWTDETAMEFALFHSNRMRGAHQADGKYYVEQSIVMYKFLKGKLDILEHIKMEPILYYNGQKNTRLTLDRSRTVNYNGEDVLMNSYECTECNEEYYFQQVLHKFCPFCGVKFENQADVSI
jgi:hypothetical protein